jgi:hypothetical protein
MKSSVQNKMSCSDNRIKRRCLSCGTDENLGRRRYCSIHCRQKLRYTLDLRTGLLKTLNSRYATFYFTDTMIAMDVLPYNSKEIFSFIYPRSSGKKPAEDYCVMSEILGNTWWAEKKRTHRNYLATRLLFEKAKRNDPAFCSVMHLKLGKSDLNSPKLEKTIKSAFRLQVKKHHPDLGGDTATFRRIHEAYLELINWAENPSYLNRRGFPDKWFYDGYKNKWLQPAPHLKGK